MDIEKYRKLYLSENWGENSFNMITKKLVDYGHPKMFFETDDSDLSLFYSSNIYNSHYHPKVESSESFWISENELCIGYEMRLNPEIFRPIFSYERQWFLNKVNADITKPVKFWNKVKSKYYLTLSKNKHIPLECVKIIVDYIY
tara:strand:+ start:448 stop:879 length:432 start_codon:yes stop_codon:yes gene_type:complete